MVSNKYRLSKDLMLVTNTTNINFTELQKIDGINQYVDNIDNTVLTDGPYEGYINKIWNTEHIFDTTKPVSNTFDNLSFKVRNSFVWDNVFGFLVIVYDTQTKEYILSQVLTQSMFKIVPEYELFENNFWNIGYELITSKLTDSCIFYVDVLSYDDFNDSGLVLTYPRTYKGFTPLVGDSVLPPEILTSIRLDEDTNHLIIQPYTTVSNKTLEQVLLEYFGYEGKVVPVEVYHVIKYGYQDNYKIIKVSNMINIYGKINIGLNLKDYYNSTIDIFVSTVYVVNLSLTVKREQQIVFDYTGILNPIVSELVKPKDGELIVLPVEVKEEVVYEQKVINTPQVRHVNTIYQKVFTEIVSKDFVWDNKSISFSEINSDIKTAVLTFDKTKLFSEKSTSGLYFDLSKVEGPKNTTEFKIYDYDSNNLILKGNINI